MDEEDGAPILGELLHSGSHHLYLAPGLYFKLRQVFFQERIFPC